MQVRHSIATKEKDYYDDLSMIIISILTARYLAADLLTMGLESPTNCAKVLSLSLMSHLLGPWIVCLTF